jgi:methylenetetrahydrofolate--tRNA-(uracil-5-)-methyltransferase
MRQGQESQKNRDNSVTVIGAGLAGSEAAYQLAKNGIPVDLYEMRPTRMTPAHKTSGCAELVCSNSFGSESAHSASHILKTELELLGAFVLKKAREHKVPAGASLAVDREKFSADITSELAAHPLITIHREELTEIPKTGYVILATGPLTTESLCADLCKKIGTESLYFYDAISPIISAESIDFSQLFQANRYDKGETADFWNIPLNKEQYETLVKDLLTGDVVLPHAFEEEKYFEGCMPIEAIAARGPQTLSFGPLKPVGLTDPKTGRWAHAVIQLRNENKYGTAFNLVGFQTKLKYPEQARIFKKLPGLENAEFLRLGSMHRNTYIHSPSALLPTLQLRADPRVFVAGQLTGTEGYLESSATGFWAAWVASRLTQSKPFEILPVETMLGSLLRWITDSERKNFQPINSNLGVLPPLPDLGPKKVEKKIRNEKHAARSQQSLLKWMDLFASGRTNFQIHSVDCEASLGQNP